MIRPEVGLLERGAELAALDEALAAVRGSGQGRLVLLTGEAGIGKTSLLRAFCSGHDDVATFRGGCDPLFTPPLLALFVELAGAAGGRLAARLARGGHRTTCPRRSRLPPASCRSTRSSRSQTR